MKKVVEHVWWQSAKSFVGKYVNLHLRDGTVFVNVFLVDVGKPSDCGQNAAVAKRFFRFRSAGRELRSVALSDVVLIQPVSCLVQLQMEVS